MALHAPPTTHLHFQIPRPPNLPRFRHRLPSPPPPNLTFRVPHSHSLRSHSISPICRCASLNSLDSFDSESDQNYASESPQIPQRNKVSFVELLKKSSSFLPHVTIASTLLALVFPPSFTWFTNRYYAPALGFLMFAVGVNSSEKDFLEAFKRPAAIFTGYIGQFVVKPLLGYIFGIISVAIFGLPTPVGAGIMLVSCVSGAQLSNYATFLTDPQMAPLSIVMTSLSTATAVFVTPFLSLLLIGKRLPVDVKGMVSSILQIVVTPIVAGLLLNRFLPQICNAIRPFLPPLSVLVTACCVGAPLAINIESVLSPFGLTILLLIITFHLTAFIAGYFLTGMAFHGAPDVKPLQRTLSYETGMQSSLLALALANRFFQDPLVGVPPAISTVVMSLMGFSLVMVWTIRKE
ncbi:putative Bile acid:sodium symporter/arsenical resistance protein Acr3 [Rosa chinensis]|uniref:Putative Bile acid:sodium symporter/arsenical resistance protein Acr3 n=1 Tax=Rosa chinensis TaxID=74649 RepID=A0A2P6P7M5_ROSCH|nr:probable sodium/metabolite cotransporter BASS6, chloroplastic [Rosa chinensis]PRQ17941.1 putative Bile acid:sodium symporter/arsenical resistance protein Acr3 [Rosa chinensis]